MGNNRQRKIDRRTRYTIRVIKEAFLELTEQEPYARITVAQVCQRAEISRSTFYLHFTTITEVLNAVLDDAFLLAEQDESFTRETPQSLSDYLEFDESLLPVCQRVGGSAKYRHLLMDPDLSEYIIGRIISQKRDQVVPALMQKTGLGVGDAETLFRYLIHGSFAINRRHHFVKDQRWAHDAELLNRFVRGGISRLKR